jgi:hypothetical protein
MALSKVGKNQVGQSASLTVDSDLTVDTNTLYVDSTNNRVGIKTVAPDLALHVEGTNAAPASSGSTPTGFVSLRQKDGGSSHGANIGVLGAPPWGTWIQGQDANNLATSYPLLLNPNGGNVGIGDNNPTQALSVGGHIKVDAGLTGYILGPTGEMLVGEDGTGFFLGTGFGANPNIPFYIGHANTASYNFRMGGSGGGNNVLAIDSSGRVTKPYQPGFSVRQQGQTNIDCTSSNYIAFRHIHTTNFNTGNHFSSSTGSFTAPVAGNYIFGTTVRYDGFSGSYFYVSILKNGSTFYARELTSLTGTYLHASVHTIMNMGAGDSCNVALRSVGDSNITLDVDSNFYGYLLG